MTSYRKARATFLWGALAMLLLSPAAVRASIVTIDLADPESGLQSGWRATFNDDVVGINVLGVSLGAGELVIQVDKKFTLPPNPETGQFQTIIVDFTQWLPDAATVGTVRIESERIVNNTGADWTDYHWEVMDHGNAWFDIDASQGFGLGPSFHSLFWWPRIVDPTRADALDVFNGLVPDGTGYLPGTTVIDTDLVIRTNLDEEAPLSFTFKQYPTPEPATVALMGMGLMAIFVRRAKPRR
ncbi:MAG: PEP-CTERM sorting domain-containing protein [Pirellulales bacterium]|nr:PEP-CTERM sorting domain-containing protein [Pirellulales bacterium]